MGRLTCRFCKAPLHKRGARCRHCGWAADYGTGTNRREREVLVGVGLMVVGLAMALAMAVVVAYLSAP